MLHKKALRFSNLHLVNDPVHYFRAHIGWSWMGVDVIVEAVSYIQVEHYGCWRPLDTVSQEIGPYRVQV